MLVIADKNISIYFGDAVSDTIDHQSAAYKDFCIDLTNRLKLDHLIIQHQTHGPDGMVVDASYPMQEKVSLFERDGDWLITNQKKVGLGVRSADCLPLIFYDKKHHAVGIAHAGWKGTVASIAQKVVQVMHEAYGSQPSDLQVIFGPSARSCCYEVGKEFEQYMTDTQLKKSLVTRDGKLFFDKTCYNTTKLIQAGLSPQSLNYQYNSCTICNHSFHSHRRKAILRQISVVFLR